MPKKNKTVKKTRASKGIAKLDPVSAAPGGPSFRGDSGARL